MDWSLPELIVCRIRLSSRIIRIRFAAEIVTGARTAPESRNARTQPTLILLTERVKRVRVRTTVTGVAQVRQRLRMDLRPTAKVPLTPAVEKVLSKFLKTPSSSSPLIGIDGCENRKCYSYLGDFHCYLMKSCLLKHGVVCSLPLRSMRSVVMGVRNAGTCKAQRRAQY